MKGFNILIFLILLNKLINAQLNEDFKAGNLRGLVEINLSSRNNGNKNGNGFGFFNGNGNGRGRGANNGNGNG